MDGNQALKIRGYIRIVCCILAAGAAITAFIYRIMLRTKAEEITGLCMTSRIFAILMFVAAAGAVVLAFMSKTFSPKIDGGAFVIALVGFIGNFVIAPGSTLKSLIVFEGTHIKNMMYFDGTQLDIGAYMIILSGVLMISYTVRLVKNGN